MSPVPSVSEAQLVELGRLLRDRRRRVGYSMRRLAAETGVSASYIGSLEAASNPATGRPAAPSLRTLTPLLETLSLEIPEVLREIGISEAPVAHREHTLLYVLGRRPEDVVPHVRELTGQSVTQWVLIPDWRETGPSRMTEHAACSVHRIRWALGAEPYPDRHLRPDRIIDALERELDAIKSQIAVSDSVGLVIADCSAVMRSVDNPESEVEFESVWAERTSRVFGQVLGRTPAATVCVYFHDDIEALGLDIDALASALTLLRTHDTVGVLDEDNQVRTGTAATTMLLHELKPRGVSSRAWRELSAAAAASLARPDAAAAQGN